MTVSSQSPAFIQYACERCQTRFVLPPSSLRLSVGGKVRAFSAGLVGTLRTQECFAAGYDGARLRLLAKVDDEAYQSFVHSFRFCHECRLFVCNECWSTSRGVCLTCAARPITGVLRAPSFAPVPPPTPRPVVATAKC